MKKSDLINDPVSKIFYHYLVPAISGTMVTSIYVLADSIIIGKGIGSDALAALNIVLPLFNIFFGIGLLFGIGGSVLMSIARGAGDYKRGENYYSIAFILNAFTSILCTLLLLWFMEPIVTFLGATDITLPYIRNYAPYIIIGLSSFSFSSFFQTFVRNDGSPKLSMIAVMSGGILNIILDIIFVYPLKMGMKGAAVASVLGAACTVVILLFHFLSKTNGLHFNLSGGTLKQIPNILTNGFTSFFVEIAAGIVMFIFNLQILKHIGEVGITMYGVIANTSIIVTCLCNGINQAAQPIASMNYGAGLTSRVEQLKKLGMKTAFVVCSVIAIIGIIVPNLFTNIFIHPTAEILELSSIAVRTYFIGFFFMGMNMFIIGYFQATLNPLLSFVLCLSRGCLFSLLFVFLLPPFIGVIGIWAAMPLAELVSFVISIYFVKKMSNKGIERA